MFYMFLRKKITYGYSLLDDVIRVLKELWLESLLDKEDIEDANFDTNSDDNEQASSPSKHRDFEFFILWEMGR